MSVSTNELTITYDSTTFGGSSDRQITGWLVDEHDYVNGSFEFEFVTTAATDAAFKTELDTVRAAFRKPRQDLTVTQNTGGGAVTLLSRKHSDNTGLDTYPHIIKDGDPADTGRSRHFRVRITYQLPADNLSQNFRRISITAIEYSPSRRRTVTIEGEYTANSTDGTTASDTQYFAQIASAETTLLNVVDSTATWERVEQGPVRYSETRKTVSFRRVYRELNVAQSTGTTDNTSIIDPHLEIQVEQLAPGDSLQARLFLTGGGTSGVSQTTSFSRVGNTVTMGTSTPSATVAAGSVKRPIFITITYDAAINFDEVNALLRPLWLSTIRPWMVFRASVYNPGGTLVIIHEQPAFEIYENHIRASMQFVSYSNSILRQKITYQDVTAMGKVLYSVTDKDPFSYYEFQGPAVRQRLCTEDYEEKTTASDANSYVDKLKGNPGQLAAGFGDDWVMISREPKADIKTQGLTDGAIVNIATASIHTVFQYRKRKKANVANAGGVTGTNVATG